MTKPTPEAVAFRAKMDTEGPDWPADLKEAATYLRCELENVPRKGWIETGGEDRLAKYAEEFSILYYEWKKWRPGQ